MRLCEALQNELKNLELLLSLMLELQKKEVDNNFHRDHLFSTYANFPKN